MDRPEAGVGHHWQCHSALPRCRRGGADVVIEAIGLPATQEEAVASLRTGGRAVLLGSSAEPMTLQSGRLMYRELAVLGTLGCRPADFPAVLDLVRRGRLVVAPLVTHRHPLEPINEGLDALRRGEGIRHIVVPVTGRAQLAR